MKYSKGDIIERRYRGYCEWEIEEVGDSTLILKLLFAHEVYLSKTFHIGCTRILSINTDITRLIRKSEEYEIF